MFLDLIKTCSKKFKTLILTLSVFLNLNELKDMCEGMQLFL